ncbi:SAM-dependent chlorinase/fluorinase [Candidatus Uhrbacteria bacterium]|nr:SAM-dependent chlorinase/fluorinase [Candidatus Uhrbacteria bacterium]
MFVTIITDCRDDNARARQETRYAHLFPGMHVSFIGATSDIEAAGNVIDVLDASDDAPGVIAVNCAPRHGRAKKWKNGSPFGYAWVGNKLIVGTVDGFCFSLLKRFKLIDAIQVTDIGSALTAGGFSLSHIDTAVHTQFRSLNYLPRLARIVWDKKEIASEKLLASDIPDLPSLVWWTDSFGNCKTSVTSNECAFQTGEKKRVTFADTTSLEVLCVPRLADVPNGQPALIEGSSGLRDHRFVELVIQGASAAEKFGLRKGDPITIS